MFYDPKYTDNERREMQLDCMLILVIIHSSRNTKPIEMSLFNCHADVMWSDVRCPRDVLIYVCMCPCHVNCLGRLVWVRLDDVIHYIDQHMGQHSRFGNFKNPIPSVHGTPDRKEEWHDPKHRKYHQCDRACPTVILSHSASENAQ